MDPETRRHLTRVTAQTVRTLRENKGISQESLALEADIGRSYISRLERGKQAPTVPTVVQLLPHLGVTFPEFAQEFCKQARRARRNKRS